MRKDQCVLGIDLGTGSAKAILLDTDGSELSVASASVQLSRPRPGWVESDPEGLVVVGEDRRGRGARGDPSRGRRRRAVRSDARGRADARADGQPLRPAMLSLDRRA